MKKTLTFITVLLLSTSLKTKAAFEINNNPAKVNSSFGIFEFRRTPVSKIPLNKSNTLEGNLPATNNALHFDGNGDYISIADNNKLDFSNAFTAEMWINPDNLSNHMALFGKFSGSTAGQRSYAGLLLNTGSIEFSISSNGSNEIYFQTNGKISINVWTHVAFAYDGVTMRVFINGVEDTNNKATSVPIFNSSSPLIIGARDEGAGIVRPFIGKIDEVKFFDYAVTASEILTEKDHSSDPAKSGLIAYYKFNEGVAGNDNSAISEVKDVTVNALDGVLSGFSKNGSSSNFVVASNPDFTELDEDSDNTPPITWSSGGVEYYFPTTTGKYSIMDALPEIDMDKPGIYSLEVEILATGFWPGQQGFLYGMAGYPLDYESAHDLGMREDEWAFRGKDGYSAIEGSANPFGSVLNQIGDCVRMEYNTVNSTLKFYAKPDGESEYTLAGDSTRFTNVVAEDDRKLRFAVSGICWQPCGIKIISASVPNSAPTDIALSENSIDENSEANSNIGTLLTTDADNGDTFSYSLVSGEGDTDNTAFSISGNNLKINASPDYETKNSYSVRIRSTDQRGLYTEKVFAITIKNLEELLQIAIPAQDATYNSSRGLWFVAPTDFTITGLRVPTDASSSAQSIQVIKMNGGIPLIQDSQNFQTLSYHKNVTGTDIIEVNLTVHQGDSIGVLATRGSVTSYGPSPYQSSIGGIPVQLFRINSQSGAISNAAATKIRIFDQYQLGRVEIYYRISPKVTGVEEGGMYNTDVSPVFVETTATLNGSPFISGTTVSEEGLYTLIVSNAEGDSNTLNFTVDKTAPIGTEQPNLATASDSGISGADNLTNVTTPIFSGSAEANSRVTLYDTDGTTSLGNAIADADGNWTITSSVMTEGEHSLTAKATDDAGNISNASSVLKVNIDLTAPSTPVGLSVTPGGAENILTWSNNAESDLALYKIYGSTSANPTTLLATITSGTTYTHTGLSTGTTYYYRVIAMDKAGNESDFSADESGVPKSTQVITFNALFNVTYGDIDFNPGASSSSGLDISYTSSNINVATIVNGKVHITGAGTTTISASQDGNTEYGSATVKTQVLTVEKAEPTLAALNEIIKTYGDADFTLAAPTSNSDGTFTYTSSDEDVATISGNTVTIVGLGTAEITVIQAATDNYKSGEVKITLKVEERTLPIVLAGFKANVEGENVLLSWTTTTESNNKKFIIYRSGDDGTFVQVGEKMGAGTSISINRYSFYDKSPLHGNNYYKLVQIDEDGKVTELDVKQVAFNFQATTFSLYPNPTTDKINIEFEAGRFNSLLVTDHSGRTLQQLTIPQTESLKALSLANYTTGIYFVRLIGNGDSRTFKVLKE